MPYAIMRFAKCKGGPAGAIQKHHEREKERYRSNPDIDLARSHLNYHLIQPEHQYYAEIQGRIEKAQRGNPKCKVRKDSVKFIDTIVTATPAFLAELSPKRLRRYFERALEFFRREVGEKNIFTAVVHMDETNPHMHLCFVPLTKDNRLSAKEVIGGREKLVEWQDKFHDHMAEEFPELERGQAALATKRKHIPTWLYKQAHRLTDEMVQIQAEIENIGAFNAGKQKEKVLELLLKWYPQVNAFENKLKPYDEQLKILASNERILRDESTRAQYLAQQRELEARDLWAELNEYREFVNTIPAALFEELKVRYEQQQDEAQNEKEYTYEL